MPTKYDLAIIGSGGGTFAAAIRADMLGKSVVMIEHGALGGTCVNMGYVPSKAFITVASARRVTVDAITRLSGIATTADPVDMPVLITGRQMLAELPHGEKYADVADSYGWQVLRGDASFVGTPDVPVLDVAGSDGSVETIGAHHYLVAAGSRPQTPPIDGLEETGYLTSATTMELAEVLESLLVLGGNYVALEQAQLFVCLGSQVMLFTRSWLASKEESKVSRALREVFADEGIRVVSRAVPTRAPRDTGGEVVVTATLPDGSQEFRADQILVALGHRPVTDGLNLDAVRVNTGDPGEVVVSDRLRSSNPRIWATSDVIGHLEFVYVVTHHGALVVENAFANVNRSVDHARLPRVTSTGPATGVVGMTKKDVLAMGIHCDCHALLLHYVPRTLVNRSTRGLIRVVVNAETKEILGLTAVAKGAGELTAAGVHALGRTITEVANAWALYLTMVGDVRIAAEAFTTDPSLLSRCT